MDWCTLLGGATVKILFGSYDPSRPYSIGLKGVNCLGPATWSGKSNAKRNLGRELTRRFAEYKDVICDNPYKNRTAATTLRRYVRYTGSTFGSGADTFAGWMFVFRGEYVNDLLAQRLQDVFNLMSKHLHETV